MKNIIIKETHRDENNDIEAVVYISSPKDGADRKKSYVSNQDIGFAFVFSVQAFFLGAHPPGLKKYADGSSKETEWIETDQEETPHWLNGWRTETKVVFTKNGVVKEKCM